MGRRTTAAIGVALVFGLLSMGVTGLAVADTDDSGAGEPTDVADQLGDLVIHSYEYDGESETMQIEATWVGSSPTTVTLTEMIELDSEGSTDISFQEQRLSPDESVTIEMGAEQRSGGTAAILVSTPQSVDNGNALVLQAGDAGGSTPIPFQWGVILVGLACATTGGGAFLVVRYFAQKETDRIERVA
ncbi:hypothetical protein [Natrialba swarupiae]|uniref:Uncharacterized protein n=1 Tax=Natrialba swarupiae TaxID=2448032 RepID=A0A5D5AQU8_9EURY|nr:hypothetical protein [Natrialba swarupiae]TYT61800.1 hypothetical protein FYC77_11180 [Natrialba swarupiae]